MKCFMGRVSACAAVCATLAWLSAGCVGCKSCSGRDDGKPVAPETFSNESGGSGEPSLPYFKPWWLD